GAAGLPDDLAARDVGGQPDRAGRDRAGGVGRDLLALRQVEDRKGVLRRRPVPPMGTTIGGTADDQLTGPSSCVSPGRAIASSQIVSGPRVEYRTILVGLRSTSITTRMSSSRCRLTTVVSALPRFSVRVFTVLSRDTDSKCAFDSGYV